MLLCKLFLFSRVDALLHDILPKFNDAYFHLFNIISFFSFFTGAKQENERDSFISFTNRTTSKYYSFL